MLARHSFIGVARLADEKVCKVLRLVVLTAADSANQRALTAIKLFRCRRPSLRSLLFLSFLVVAAVVVVVVKRR